MAKDNSQFTTDNSSLLIYQTDDGKAKVALMAKDGNIRMNQNQLAELFDTSKQNIGQHIKKILEDKDLEEDSVVKNYFITATYGKKYEVAFYSLDVILLRLSSPLNKNSIFKNDTSIHHLQDANSPLN